MNKHLVRAAVAAAALGLTGMALPTSAPVLAFTGTAVGGTLLCRALLRHGRGSGNDTGRIRRPTVTVTGTVTGTVPVVPATGNVATLLDAYARLPRATTTSRGGYGNSRSLLIGTVGVNHSGSLVGVRR